MWRGKFVTKSYTRHTTLPIPGCERSEPRRKWVWS